MSKRINAKKKISRKIGAALWGQAKDPQNKRNYRPGQHGKASRGRVSDYGNQLRAKQKMKFYYGNISEKQFYNTFVKANSLKGDVAENFISLLELRLDAVVYRANFIPTVFSARQLVSHKHVTVNGKVVNIPSYKVNIGDVVQIRDKSKTIPIVVESLQKIERDVPVYLQLDKENFSVKVVAKPEFGQVPYPVEMNPNLIIEFYSR